MKSNKGFSLVELIIVIAIMAVLVGIMAPQLLKYIEKSNVAVDLDFIGQLESAMTYGITEAEIMMDPPSVADINTMINSKMALENLDPSSLLYAEVCDTLGLPNLNFATYSSVLHSAHGSNCHIYMTYNGDVNNPVKIWINETDMSGMRVKTYNANSITDANFEKVIHIN